MSILLKISYQYYCFGNGTGMEMEIHCLCIIWAWTEITRANRFSTVCEAQCVSSVFLNLKSSYTVLRPVWPAWRPPSLPEWAVGACSVRKAKMSKLSKGTNKRANAVNSEQLMCSLLWSCEIIVESNIWRINSASDKITLWWIRDSDRFYL